MATVSIAANNTRLEDAESATGWASIGGGAGGAAEGSFFYQGTLLFNRKVTSATGAGFYYNPASDGGAAQNMTAAATRTWLVKAIVTDFGGLQTLDGLRIHIGSGTTAYYEYVIAGSNAKINSLGAYPARGGFIVIPIDPNIAAYREATVGTPVLTAVDYFGCVAAFATASAKSENLGLDAIDLGTGLTLTGGDGADPDGVWQDFIDADEGNITNRWGFASSTLDAVALFFGTMQIGSATATVFNDIAAQILWVDGYFQAGWSRVLIDLQNASTSVTDGSTHTGLGNTTAEDSRPDYTVTGTAGAFTFNGILNNFRNVNISKGTIDGASIEAQYIDLNGVAIMDDTVVTAGERITGTVAVMTNQNDVANISNITFIKDVVSTLRSAISFTTAGTYTFDALFFENWGADGSNTAAILNDSGGLVTINITGGGNTPTVRNVGASTTTINNNTLVTLTGVPVGAEVRIYNDTGTLGSPVAGTEIDGIETTVASSFAFSAPAAADVIIVIFDEDQIRDGGVYLQYVVPATDTSVPLSLLSDRVYLNP